MVTPLRIHALHPRLLRGLGAMELMQEKAALLDPALKALAQLKAAKMVDCPF